MPLAATQEGEPSGSRAPAPRRGRSSTAAATQEGDPSGSRASTLRRGRSSTAAATQEEEPSGSRAPALRCGRSSTDAATQEGEASGSRVPAPRRGRSFTSAAMATTMALVLMRRQSSPGSQSTQEPLVRSKRRKRKRREAGNQRLNKRKRTRQEEKGEEREDDEVSSAGSSPLRELEFPDEAYDYDCPVIWNTIEKARDDIKKKLDRRTAWATLNRRMISGFMCALDDPKLVPDRESARKAVLNAAQCVVGLTSSVDGNPLARCCGFWIHWDEKNKVATVLTTSQLICTKSPSMNAWLGQEKYDLDAEVFVHLRGNTTEKAHLQYLQKHYDLAFFSVKLDQAVQILSFSDGVKHADQVFELGRDESSFLRISHGVVRYSEPNLFQRYHYMHVDGADLNAKYGKGGPLIHFDGKIAGMVNGNIRGSFIPSSILIKCLHLWSKFQRIPRPELGMKFWPIKLAEPALAENILYMCNIDDGLIVEEVSEGSPAEKLGIRDGDVITSVNGEHVTTTVELENVLLSKCEDGSGSLSSEVDVKLLVFHVRKSLWRNITLTVNVSDDGEIVHKGVRRLFAEGFTPSVPRIDPCVQPLFGW